MIRNYPECVNEMGTAYEVKKAVESGKLYRIEKGVYADTPSIRCSSAYTTEDQVYRRELIKNKKKWVVSEDFKRVFGRKTENDKIKENVILYHIF